MSVLLQGVLLYGEGDPVDVRLAEGRIAEIGAGLSVGDSRPVPAAGLVLLPGLVDLHTHLREPGREDAETVETGTLAAALGGFTAVHAMANTDPVAANAGVVEQVWRLGRIEGLKVTIVGDILHSRVARSNVLLLHTLGADVTLVAPPTLLPVGVGAWPAEVSYDLDAVLPKSDVVMMLRVQKERMGAAYFPSTREYSRRYGLDVRRVTTLADDAIVMHPGPMIRGMEIAPEVADGLRSTIVEQVANGVSVRMAVLYLLLGGSQPAIGVATQEGPGR